MRAFYVEADWAPKDGYKLSERELSTKRALRGNSIWKNIRGSVTDRPEPVAKDDEVLLKIGAAGICGTDAHLLKKGEDGYSLYNGHSKYPIIIGHEFSGEVVEVGRNVKRLKVGDLVSVESMHWCGECDACRMGMFNQCKNLDEPGLTFDGGFAEYAAIKEKYCYVLNDIVNHYGDKMTAFELGAMIEPTGVAYNGLFVRGGGLRPGGHAVVFGAGPIGLAAISLLKTAGAAKLIAFETVPERQRLAKECGADYVFNPNDFESPEAQAEMLMELTNGRGIALFAECSGATKFTYPVMAGSLAIGGKTIQIGHTLGITPVDIFNWQWNAASISGSNGQSGEGIYSDVIALMASGRIDMRKMVTGRFHLEDIEEGLKLTSGKVLVSMDYDRLK
ncbi:scyllo-inosose 3-dehydrogenase [Anaerotalea alkaliphila]|uniref:Alcohol dehydrogenase catalytic domain-containing protein n=1 Tax=Anaerotalea alkaliphila TaxID=2662126 RepID=A0A7X5HXA9_9FIRM|nr:scyllo-inosose 3-dehydrogenase [Anaerotalea alkaliphila]NDL68379.1 alcohol dehydrogenase catalytic domain-containing protein [Anaerotalea alkaliphila]